GAGQAVDQQDPDRTRGLEMFKMTSEIDYGAMVMEKGKYFLAGLQDLQKRYPIIGDVDGLGLALRCEICTTDGFTPDKATLDYMVEEGMKGDIEINGQRLGLILDVGGYYKNVITLAPSLEISYAEIDLGIALLDRLLDRAMKR
ncbi:hypothetical protein HUS96_32985, partial [Pseudomonas protegens]|nr:hypothetical protein [Pseudomonas protegens]